MARAKKKCGQAGCPELTDGAFCPAHVRPHPHAKWGTPSPASRDRAPRDVREWVRHRDNGTCQLCGGPGHEVDHILCVAWGGGHERRNLQCVCPRCHRKKTREEVVLGTKYRGRPPGHVIAAHIRAWSRG